MNVTLPPGDKLILLPRRPSRRGLNLAIGNVLGAGAGNAVVNSSFTRSAFVFDTRNTIRLPVFVKIAPAVASRKRRLVYRERKWRMIACRAHNRPLFAVEWLVTNMSDRWH